MKSSKQIGRNRFVPISSLLPRRRDTTEADTQIAAEKSHTARKEVTPSAEGKKAFRWCVIEV